MRISRDGSAGYGHQGIGAKKTDTGAMPYDDESFYRRRLLQEEEAIRRATTNAGRLRHEELAGAYRFRLKMAVAGDLVPARLRVGVDPSAYQAVASGSDGNHPVQLVPNMIIAK